MTIAELFKVTCVTCRASLSVRNPALIGQIVACPKCESMVEIAPPSAEAPVAAVTTAVATMPAQPTATQPAIAQPTFEEPVETLTAEPAAEAAVTPPITEIASVLEIGAASSAKFIMWSVASFVIGATLVGTFLVMRSSDSADQISTPAAMTETTIATTAEPAEPEPHDSPVASADELALEKSLTKKPSPGVIDNAEENSDDNPFAVADAQAEVPLTGPIEQPVETETPTEPTVAPTLDEPEPRLVITDQPRVARKFDPLALDPEQMNLSTLSAAANESETDAIASKSDPQESNASSDESPDKPSHVNVAKLVKITRDTGLKTESLSAEIQLQRVLPAIAVKNMPLNDFMIMISQLGGVPVSIAPDQLQMAGISSRIPVSIDASEKSLADVFASVLDPLHLEAITTGPQITIVRQHGARVRSVDYPIDDLLGGKTTATEFAQWIEKLIAPESWESAGGKGQITVSAKSLRIEQTQAVQYQVLFFVERIRLAKQLPLRSRYPERLLSDRPHAAMIATRLTAPAVFTFSVDTSLAEVFHFWQNELGMSVFVDWPALAQNRLWPETLITCAVSNEPWHAALDKVLTPLDLDWRPAPGGGIQITSRARVETEPQLDIYPSAQWHGDATDVTVVKDTVNDLTYVRAPASRLRLSGN